MRNVERDQKNAEELKILGWNVITIWECELKKTVRDENLNLLVEKIRNNVDRDGGVVTSKSRSV